MGETAPESSIHQRAPDPFAVIHTLRLAHSDFAETSSHRGVTPEVAKRLRAEDQAKRIMLLLQDELLGEEKPLEGDLLLKATTRYDDPQKVKDFLRHYVTATTVLRHHGNLTQTFETLLGNLDVYKGNLGPHEEMWVQEAEKLNKEWFGHVVKIDRLETSK